MKQIYCGFPGIGKTTFFTKLKGEFPNITVIDLDSSPFYGENYPNNYIQFMLLENIRLNDSLMLLMSHDKVREALHKTKIDFTLVYPDRSLKEEYMERYRKRGNSEFFLDLIENNWDDFIDSCEQDTATKIVLKSGEYLSDVLKLENVNES